MLVGFGTRNLLDEVVKPFVEREGGKFWDPKLFGGQPCRSIRTKFMAWF
jgi:hypothetical protein